MTLEFIEFAEELKKWRAIKYKSALELFNKETFSFSYRVYSGFERGEALPTVKQLLEITDTLNIDAIEASLLWVRTQMPREELKKVFQGRQKPRIEVSTKPTPPLVESTWFFGPPERKILLKTPWLWDIIVFLSLNYPKEFDACDLPYPKNVDPNKLFDTYLKTWITDGHIIKIKNKIKLRVPNAYLPKSSEWNAIRQNNLKRGIDHVFTKASDEMLIEGKIIQMSIQRPLTKDQSDAWLKRFQEIEPEFIKGPYLKSAPDAKNYGLYIVFGPR